MAAPDVTFSASKTALGVGDFITVSFTSDIAMSAFEARATTFGAAYGVGIGTLVGAFSATPAGVQRTFEIYETELVNGDGQYRISLFAQSAISIHAPRAGSDVQYCHHDCTDHYISIHAPRAGSDSRTVRFFSFIIVHSAQTAAFHAQTMCVTCAIGHLGASNLLL
ncbi:MAG: hypothetical protein RSC90_09315 [Clostridia bacterium]